MKKTEATNTGKSVKNDSGFIMKRFGPSTVYVKSTGNGTTIWVAKYNPTAFASKLGTTWGVYNLSDTGRSEEVEAEALGFKTHRQAEDWVNSNF